MMPQKESELAKQYSQLNLTDTTVVSCVSIRGTIGTGNAWNRHKIHSENKIISGIQDLESDTSSAEKRIATFNERTDCNYVYLTYEPLEGLVMMTGKTLNMM